MEDIDQLRIENKNYHEKVSELMDKLERSEEYILRLSEDVLNRDNKVAILENHINQLEDEIRSLQINLAAAVESGEEMRVHHQKKIETSLDAIQAHHSKAAHNMKMEIANLHKVKDSIEKELLLTKINSEENMKDKEDHFAQMLKLQNEKHEILNELQQLEINTVGESDIVVKESNIELVRKSLERISKTLEARNSKAICLEQTLLKVETSSQILLKKADEAKKIIEKEKIKILREKEEALWDKQKIENIFLLQKQELEEQILHDKCKIREIESELRNQKLLADKINQSTQEYISKLEGELINLQNIYQGALSKNSVLHDKNQSLENSINQYQDTINKVNNKIKDHENEIKSLKMQLNKLKDSEILNEKQYAVKEIQTDSYASDITLSNLIECDIVHRLPIPYCTNNIVNDIVDFQTQSAIVDALSHRIDKLPIKSDNFSINQRSLDKIKTNKKEINEYSDKNDVTKLTCSPIEQHSIQSFTDQNKLRFSNALDNINSSQIYTEISNKENMSKINIDKVEVKPQIPTEFINLYNKPPKLKKPKTNENILIEKNITENTLPKEQKILDDKSVKKNSTDVITNESSFFRIYDELEEQNAGKYYRSPRSSQSDRIKKDTNFTKYSTYTRNSLQVEIENLRKDDFFKDSGSSNQQSFINKEEVLNEQTHDLEIVKKSLCNKIKTCEGDNDTDIISENKLYENENPLSKKILNLEDMSQVKLTKQSYILSTDNKIVFEDQTESLPEKETDSQNAHYNYPADLLTNIQSSNQHNNMSHQNRSSGICNGLDVVSGVEKCKKLAQYENDIEILKTALSITERDCAKKILAIKLQYDTNIQRIINEHNEGVQSLQSLHEETIKDIIKCHENEVESIRTTNIEAMKRIEKLRKENRDLKRKLSNISAISDEVNEYLVDTTDRNNMKDRGLRMNQEAKLLSKTIVEAFDVKPRRHGPCTCTADLDTALSHTLRNMFDKGDNENRKLAEQTYLKRIATKLVDSGQTEVLYLLFNILQTIEEVLNSAVFFRVLYPNVAN